MGWFAPILAGPIKVMAIDVWALLLKRDTNGLYEPIMNAFGLYGP